MNRKNHYRIKKKKDFVAWARAIERYFEGKTANCPYIFVEKYIVSNTKVVVDGQGEDDPNGVDWENFLCWAKNVQMPETIIARIEGTYSLQGTLSDSWEVLDGRATVEANWSYHPRSGLMFSAEISSPFLEDYDPARHSALLKKFSEIKKGNKDSESETKD